MSPARPSAVHRRAVRAQTGRRAPVAIAGANTAPSSATRRVPAHSRARRHCRRRAISCGPATPTVVRSSGLVPALPALHASTTITGSAANRGIATSLLSFRFVMPQRCRIRLPFCCRKAASLSLPSYLHARRSRNFRSAVLGRRLLMSCAGLR
jgi:hypothetical protein